MLRLRVQWLIRDHACFISACGWVLFKEYVDYWTAVKKCQENEEIGKLRGIHIQVWGHSRRNSYFTNIPFNYLQKYAFISFSRFIKKCPHLI